MTDLSQLVRQHQEASRIASANFMDSFATFKTNIMDIMSHREDEVMSFYNELDKWENTVPLTKIQRRDMMCDKLEVLPQEYDEYFMDLQDFVCSKHNNWGVDQTTPVMKSFAAFNGESDSSEVKDVALSILRTLDFESVRRFIDEIIGNGVSEEYFIFCKEGSEL